MIFDGAYDSIADEIGKTSVEKVIVASPADSLPIALKVAYNLKVKKPSLDGNVFQNWKSFIKNGKGVAFTVPLTSVIGVSAYRFLSDDRDTQRFL